MDLTLLQLLEVFFALFYFCLEFGGYGGSGGGDRLTCRASSSGCGGMLLFGFFAGDGCPIMSGFIGWLSFGCWR